MTIKIFGHPRCPDCVSLRASIMANEGRIAFEGHDISQLEDLHAFMALRDKSPAFDRSKEIGDIGIPCIVTASGRNISGSRALRWFKLMARALRAALTAVAASLRSSLEEYLQIGQAVSHEISKYSGSAFCFQT